jgi:hypothetical protein
VLKNEICICSGDQIRSGYRSPFRNFELQEDFPTPRHPDFVDFPGTKVVEETHFLVAGQAALWRIARVDLPPNPTAAGFMRKGSHAVYDTMLVVKIRGKDLWFAVEGRGMKTISIRYRRKCARWAIRSASNRSGESRQSRRKDRAGGRLARSFIFLIRNLEVIFFANRHGDGGIGTYSAE